LSLFTNKHLIRSEWRAGARWYELTHDRIVNPILASNKRWQEQEFLKSRRRNRIISIMLAILFILGISISVAIISQRQATANQNFLAAQTATAQVQTQAINLYNMATSREPAINDPLSSQDANNWDTYKTTNYGCVFTGGAYHVYALQPVVTQCFMHASNFSNFAFQAQMTIIRGDGVGLIFRATSVNSSYRFRIGIDGTYDLFITSKGINPIISTVHIPAINTGSNQPNVLAVIAIGSTIYLYVNRQPLGIVRDSTFSSGEIGLFAVNFSNPTDVAFSYAKVWAL
jgi:hypothetical protein